LDRRTLENGTMFNVRKKLPFQAAYNGSFLPTFWSNYRSHYQGSSSSPLAAGSLKIGSICCPETSVINYPATQRGMVVSYDVSVNIYVPSSGVKPFFLDRWILENGTNVLPETSVINYPSMQRGMVVSYAVSVNLSVPSSGVKPFFLDRWILENGTNILSRNADKKLQFYKM